MIITEQPFYYIYFIEVMCVISAAANQIPSLTIFGTKGPESRSESGARPGAGGQAIRTGCGGRPEQLF